MTAKKGKSLVDSKRDTLISVAPPSPSSNTTRHQALVALFGGICFFIVALPGPDLLGGLIPWFLEGHYTFAFRSLQALTVAAMFGVIIVTRTLLVWVYWRWAKRRRLFSVRLRLMRPDLAWCVAAVVGAVAINALWMHLTGEPHHFTWEGFIRYWGALAGTGNTILQYAYYATEGFAVVWIVDAFQKAGELSLPGLRFPWGGLGLMVTWGTGHYFSKDLATAIYAVLISLIIGLLHLASRKSVWPSLVFWLVMAGG